MFPDREDLPTLAAPGSHERAPLSPGARVKHYEIIRTLGQGGMGVVYLARDTRLGRLVALKVLIEQSGVGAARFLAEARATARCKHENIVVIHEVDELDGSPYLVFEHLEGRTLREWMVERDLEGQGDPLPPSVVVSLVLPAVRALSCAHQLGIVHRDLKPENIFMTLAGVIKVLDFGVAKELGAREMERLAGREEALSSLGPLTEDGPLLGTLPYISPEQWRSEDVDARSDIWAVGVILHELCTGAYPLDLGPIQKLACVADLNLPMPSVRLRRPDVGPLGDIVDRCLAKRRSDRFATAEDLAAALVVLMEDEVAAPQRQGEDPFAGLSSFQEADAARFFGRDHEIASLVGRLRSLPLVVLAGPSGAGKSSLVRAGVIPALKRSGAKWEAFVLRPGRTPLAALAAVLADREGEARPTDLGDALRAEPGLFGASLRARCRAKDGQHRLLLFVDQFEELYTLGADASERAAFIACLSGAADDATSPVRVMISARSDFLDRMAEDRRFMTEVTRGLVFLPPMGESGLREALTRPIEAARCRFESEEMIEGMLAALERTRSPLPLLQFTAVSLWDARDRGRRLLTQESYEKLGGVAGALSTHADAVMAALSAPDQRLCREVFLRLCTPDRTRAVVKLSELRALAEDFAAIDQVIHHLEDARLLVIETGADREDTTVELAHESLIERWARLKQWLDESALDARFLARLRPAAQQWAESGEAEGLLWRDRAAEDAEAWLERRRAGQEASAPLGLGQREERFLRAVATLSERARRRRWQVTAALIAALAATALIVSFLAIRARREAARADREASQVLAEARQVRNATRIAVAREHIDDDPAVALAFLREIEPPGVPRGWSDLVSAVLERGIARVLRFHDAAVSSAAFSPDGDRFVVALSDGTAEVWRADGSGQAVVLGKHAHWVWSATWSPDGERIATASADGTARVWRADGTGDPVILRGHEGEVGTATWSPDGKRLVTASEDRTARVWSADGTGDPIVIRGHDGPVMAAAFSPDGERIVTASRDNTARVWRADGAGDPLVLRGHTNQVYSAAWSPDGKRIVTGSKDKTIRVWSADKGEQLFTLAGHEDTIHTAVFSPDGARILSSSNDKTARVWRADGAGDPLVLRGHSNWVYDAAWSPDGTRVMTSSLDHTARIWRVDLIHPPLVLRGHEDQVNGVTWSPDGKVIVTASGDKTAWIFRLDDPYAPTVLRHDDWVTPLAMTPDGKLLFTGTGDKLVERWSLEDTSRPLILRGHEGAIEMLAVSPDGKKIASASKDRTARVWNVDGTGTPVILRGHEKSLVSVAWSPDGARLLTGAGDGTARVWRADGAGEPLVLRGHIGETGAAWSPEGTRILTFAADGVARVWSADTGVEIAVLRGHTAAIGAGAWSPDGERVATGSQDRTVRVWSADGKGDPVILRGHEGATYSVAWSADGRRILTASKDKTARVWNADGSAEPAVLFGHEGTVYSAQWSPDGKQIVTASEDRTARVWADIAPFTGVDDPRLWIPWLECPSIERRIDLLGVSEATARAELGACERRLAGANR